MEIKWRVMNLVLLFYFHSVSGACTGGSKCQLRDICIKNENCDSGLHCETCIAAGNLLPRCTRIQPLGPFSVANGLPFNKYSWLTTHNSFAILGEPSHTGTTRITFSNQQDSVTEQLNNGVRGFMLDMYDFQNDVWLCHSFDGACYNFTAFEPAINTLREIEGFLASHPTEIVTIFIEDYVKRRNALNKLFIDSGLKKYWFPVSKMPKQGEDWPTVTSMAANNQRLVVFTSKSYKEAGEGIAYQWKYIVETQYGNAGMKSGTCKNRAESAALSVKNRSLVLQNFFPDNPNLAGACKDNSSPLSNMLSVCHSASGKWANFVAVDFYKRSDGGGASAAIDKLNGQLICGCDDLTSCKSNTTGMCNISPALPEATDPMMNTSSAEASLTLSFQILGLILITFLYLYL